MPVVQRHALWGWTRLGLAFSAAAAVSGVAAAEDTPEALVGRLQGRQVGTPPDKRVEDALVALGAAALPALEAELRLGLRGQESQAYVDYGPGRRWAVVRVLARIPDAGSTDLLVRALADHPDTLGMRIHTLQAVEARSLTTKQLAFLLDCTEPAPVLLALRKLGLLSEDAVLRPHVLRLHAPERAREQLRNEFGSPMANADQLWEVRLASGKALGIDMVSEMSERARGLLVGLRATVAGLTSDAPAAFLGSASQAELDLLHGIGALAALGDPARVVLRAEKPPEPGPAAAVFDMARLALGETDRVEAVAAALSDSPSGSIRYVAAVVLRKAKDRRAIPALWKALQDPLRRESGSCIRIGDGQVYPVRQAAADALVQLGEDPKAVRAATAGAPAK